MRERDRDRDRERERERKRERGGGGRTDRQTDRQTGRVRPRPIQQECHEFMHGILYMRYNVSEMKYQILYTRWCTWILFVLL